MTRGASPLHGPSWRASPGVPEPSNTEILRKMLPGTSDSAIRVPAHLFFRDLDALAHPPSE